MKYLLLPALVALSSTTLAKDQDYSEEIITTTHRHSLLLDTVGNAAQIDEATLERIDATHIQDTLVRVPGVNLHQGNGQEYLPAIRSAVLSGPGACGAFLTAQDNIPLRAAGFCNINELFEADSEQAQRIEVIRGPSNALYGSNAMYGVINVIMPGAPDSRRSTVGVEAGQNDYARVKLSYGDRFGDQGFIVNFNGTHDGGFRDDAYLHQQKLHARHEYDGGDTRVATTFSATNLNQETAGYIVGTDSYKDDDIIKTNPNPEAYRDASSFRLYSRVEMDMTDNQMLTITPYWRKTDMNFLQHFLPGTPLEENGQDSIGTMLAWYDDINDDLHWIVGVDVELTDSFLKETQSVPSFSSRPLGKHYDYDVNATVIAPYAQLDWRLSEKWRLNAGIRFDYTKYDYDNKMISGNTRDDGTPCPSPSGCVYSRPADSTDSFDNWSPKLGILYYLNDNARVFANFSHGFRAPQATELYRLQGMQQIADIKSEELNSIELGIRAQRENYGYEAVVYQMKSKNLIIRDSSLFNRSGGKTDHFGVELALNVALAEDWDLSLVANYSDQQYAKDLPLAGISAGDQVDSAPKHFGSAQLNWKIAEPVNVELEWVHMGSYYTDTQNMHSYDGHDLFNVRALWKLNNHWDFALRVLNLTDENYAERADYTIFSGDRYFPGEPRAIYLQANFRH